MARRDESENVAAHAVVDVTVQVQLRSAWSASCSVAEVHRAACERAETVVRERLDSTRAAVQRDVVRVVKVAPSHVHVVPYSVVTPPPEVPAEAPSPTASDLCMKVVARVEAVIGHDFDPVRRRAQRQAVSDAVFEVLCLAVRDERWKTLSDLGVSEERAELNRLKVRLDAGDPPRMLVPEGGA